MQTGVFASVVAKVFLTGFLARSFYARAMIAAATQVTAHANNSIVDTINNLPFNWFDIALVLLLLFGILRGRKNGMTKEVIPLFEWLAVVAAAGFGYLIAAQIFINSLAWSRTSSYVVGYLLLAAIVFFIFLIPRKYLNPKLEGSNIFGGSEYYLGMLSGLIRYACVVIFVLALMNAPVYTAADVAATKAYNNRWYGGGEKNFSGDFFPDFHTVQESVFKNSFTGPLVKNNLSMLLIVTGESETPKPTAQPPVKKPVITFQ